MAKRANRSSKVAVPSKPHRFKTVELPKGLKWPQMAKNAFLRVIDTTAVAALPSVVASTTNLSVDQFPPSDEYDFESFKSIPKLSARNFLQRIFTPLIGNPAETVARTCISDEKYLACPIQFVREFALMEPFLQPGAYRPDIFDCDDFVQFLKVKMSFFSIMKRLPMPLAIGFIMTDRHAFNLVFDPSGALCILNTESPERRVVSDPANYAAFLDIIDPATGRRNGNKIVSIYF